MLWGYLCLVRLAPDIGAVADRANNLLRPSPIRGGRSERIVAVPQEFQGCGRPFCAPSSKSYSVAAEHALHVTSH